MYPGPTMDPEFSEPWVSVLKRARTFLSENGHEYFEDAFGEFLGGWDLQMREYTNFLSRDRDRGALADEDKSLIVETRAALRFGVCCLSCDNEKQRRDFQRKMVETHQWHVPLSALLSLERGDYKCRVSAARLFSNLVTSNDVTASIVTAKLALSPSNDEVSNNILKTISSNDERQGACLQKPNWVSMLISSARGADREALAGVAAALHNCTVALVDEKQLAFAKRLASDSMLISTLLRQFVSVNAVKASVDTNEDSKLESEWDAATDWIFLLLIRLMSYGMLPHMFRVVGGKGSATSFLATILPEQNVLLHCAAQEAQSFLDAAAKNPETKNPFGGAVGWETTVSSYQFLADLFCKYYHGTDSSDEMDFQLSRSAALSSLDIISISLGVDTSDCAKLREHLASNTELLRSASTLLGSMVDDLTDRSAGLKARDLKLSPEEQQWMVSLVRLLGNICYHCRLNQDRLRMTLVPPSKASLSPTTTSNLERNAIHVLLSCTAFATSCFTLREWGVVAIRNILHENEANQSVVAALEAQDAIQSAALDQAGVRVNLDKKGNVSLSTLDEDKES